MYSTKLGISKKESWIICVSKHKGERDWIGNPREGVYDHVRKRMLLSDSSNHLPLTA